MGAAFSGPEPIQEGVFKIQNVGTTKYLNVDGGKTADGTNAIVWKTDDENCHFELKKIGERNEYTLQSVKTKKFITVKDGKKDDGTNVVLGKNTADSRWRIVKTGATGEAAGSSRIVSITTHKDLNVNGGEWNVIIYGSNPEDKNSLWGFIPVTPQQ
mmetsp:Transcript_31139/g.70073  ORF Transcript_31139/g.70073 Transcript_31139/m.70073 type:complete len:157 (+) Transcript_31139:87-557(+)